MEAAAPFGGQCVSLDTPLNMAGGGVINLNHTFTTWWNNPATRTVAAPYVHSLYLFNHESRHNEPGDPGHSTCTAWTGAPAVNDNMDATFEPGSGFARATLYVIRVLKYARYDPPAIRAEAKSGVDACLQQRHRAAAPQDVRVDPLVAQGRAGLRGGLPVGAQALGRRRRG